MCIPLVVSDFLRLRGVLEKAKANADNREGGTEGDGNSESAEVTRISRIRWSTTKREWSWEQLGEIDSTFGLQHAALLFTNDIVIPCFLTAHTLEVSVTAG